jgi:Ca2+-binding EF-hand superfamily protein
MNIRTASAPLVLGSLLALLGVACGANADTVATQPGAVTVADGRSSGGRTFDPARMLQRFDRNSDGRTEVTELPPRMQERATEIDANHDGVVVADELTAHMQARRAARFAQADANHDGALTVEEVGEQRWNFMSRADANHDSRVTSDELTAAHAAGGFRGRHGGMDGHNGMGGRGHGRGGHGFGFGHGEGRMGPPDPAAMTQRFDRNGDGRVEVTELPPRMQERAGMIDANHDGVIATDEFTTFIAQRRAMHHPEGAPGAAPPVAPVAPAAPTQQ